MEGSIQYLWERAVNQRARKFSYFTKTEKIRLKHELSIISQTNTIEQIMSFVLQADEARQKGNFYVKGGANCSFLLYSVGATTINPMLIGSQFERFINPLMKGSPYYEIVFSPSPLFLSEENNIEINELIIKRAVDYGFIKSEQLNPKNSPHNALSYQFIKEVLAESNGNIIWQEQVIELLSRMGGFSYAEADLLRRDSAKGYIQNPKWYSLNHKKFMDNAIRTGYDYHFADTFFKYIFEANLNAHIKAHIAAVVLQS